MPEPDPIDHHRDIPYAEIGYRRQMVGFRAEPTLAGSGFELIGVCPACGGRTTMLFERGSPQGHKGLSFRRNTSARSPRPPAAGEVTVYCDCGHVHENRPTEAIDNGCGAFWQVELP